MQSLQSSALIFKKTNAQKAYLIFALQTNKPFAKPKEPNFIHGTDNGIINSLIFANICQDNNIIMAAQIGDKIRELRTKQNLLLRQVASKLEVDTTITSKMESGERPIKKAQIAIFSDIFKADNEELHTLWLADQAIYVNKDDPLAY